MATVTTPTPLDQRVVLHDIAWDTYERLLAHHLDSSAPRFTYDRGELEILSPSTEHEEYNRTFALMVELIAMELSLDIRNGGSMTFKRQRLQRGFEPDSSFYIQNEERVRGRRHIDLSVDPPPDVIIEIEMSRSAMLKLPIYAAMSVPEVWPWDGERVRINRFIDGEYAETEGSIALPPLTGEIMTRLLIESQSLRRTAWIQHVRAWARDQQGR